MAGKRDLGGKDRGGTSTTQVSAHLIGDYAQVSARLIGDYTGRRGANFYSFYFTQARKRRRLKPRLQIIKHINVNVVRRNRKVHVAHRRGVGGASVDPYEFAPESRLPVNRSWNAAA